MNIGVYKTLTRNLKLAIEKRVPIITLLFFGGGGGGGHGSAGFSLKNH